MTDSLSSDRRVKTLEALLDAIDNVLYAYEHRFETKKGGQGPIDPDIDCLRRKMKAYEAMEL